MKQKRIFYSELAYVAGIFILAFGTALMERANFGMSMIVAPAYLLHLRLSEFLPFVTFGVAEYFVQALVLILLCIIIRKFRPTHLFSFGTAVFYGLVLDMFIFLIGLIPSFGIVDRVICFAVGIQFCTLGVAFFFKTYISPESYDLLVKEIVATYHTDLTKTKIIYDCAMLSISLILSFSFFGFLSFVGIGWGTIICTLLNGFFIGQYSKLLDKVFDFKDGLPFRKYFE